MFGIGKLVSGALDVASEVTSTAVEVATLGQVSPDRRKVKDLLNTGMDVYAVASATGLGVDVVRDLAND